jgi:hypothetical protein
VVEPLLDNPRSLMAKVAAVLGGQAIQRPQLTGFLNSEFDPFLNHCSPRARSRLVKLPKRSKSAPGSSGLPTSRARAISVRREWRTWCRL